MSHSHISLSIPFYARASLPSTPPLSSYLFHLMSLKRSNLCLSADVTTTSELLVLAEQVGDSICLLKTHADIISDFSDRTVRQLKDIAERKHFLVFEDRKFGDIGSTVQKQYAGGPCSIATWAEVTTAHIFPGPSVVSALQQAATGTIATFNTRVHTEISAGSPIEEEDHDGSSAHQTGQGSTSLADSELDRLIVRTREARKQSTVSISTTISTRSEPMSPLSSSFVGTSLGSNSTDSGFASLGPIPFLRSILLLAEMSSEDNLFTPAYTAKCVQVARQHSDFVMGFISQKSLNSDPGDNFLIMTPGVKLPAADSQLNTGDGLGQQYRTPQEVIERDGADVIIVGRGILDAEDRSLEAERYRREAWKAYEARVGLHS